MHKETGKKIIRIGACVVAGVAVVAGGLWYNGRTEQVQDKAEDAESVETANQPAQEENKPEPIITMDNGLQIEDQVSGTGAVAVAGKRVTVHYDGTLTDGTRFDSSYERGTPFTFTLGAGEVIQGWDLGVAGMKVGGKRRLVIPAGLGYGAQGAGSVIPPNATLDFTVELLGVK